MSGSGVGIVGVPSTPTFQEDLTKEYTLNHLRDPTTNISSIIVGSLICFKVYYKRYLLPKEGDMGRSGKPKLRKTGSSRPRYPKFMSNRQAGTTAWW